MGIITLEHVCMRGNYTIHEYSISQKAYNHEIVSGINLYIVIKSGAHH